MKKIWTLSMVLLASVLIYAQTDSTTKNENTTSKDTIRIGSITIIHESENEKDSAGERKGFRITTRKDDKKESNLRTNWWIVDLGFANYDDMTNYNSLAAQQFAPGSTEDWFSLNNRKSSNVNIWIFMQKLNMIKHVVNLKYGLGLELNNYRYDSPVIFQTNTTKVVIDNSKSYKKNKLAADYITVPMMLNFNLTPERRKGFGFSVGASAAYLYSSRQKTVTLESVKHRERDDFELNPFKLSYLGELQLGPVILYGSIASQSMFKKGLDQKPYNIGIRFSNW